MTPIELLHDAVLDGDLNAEQVKELRTLLADPEQRQTWKRLSTLTGRLHEELGTVAPAQRRRMPRRSQKKPATRLWLWSGLAAAAALLMAIGGWWIVRESPLARLEIGSLNVGGITLHAGDHLVSNQSAIAAGDGAVVLADGSRCAWVGATRFTIEADGARVRLATGELNIQAMHQPAGRSLAIVTNDCEARVVGTHFRVRALADRTWVGVDDGAVAVHTSVGQVMVMAGQATTAMDGKIPLAHAMQAPATWRMALNGPVQPEWIGRPHAGGLSPLAAPEDPPGDPRRYVRTPKTAAPGLVQLSSGLAFRAEITAARPGPVEIFLLCNNPLNNEFHGLLRAKAHLIGNGSSETLALGLDRFETVQGDGPHIGHAAISCVIVQWWGDDLDSTVFSLAIEP
ncbi:MAG: FecR family protein [Planctomycetota bacterium]